MIESMGEQRRVIPIRTASRNYEVVAGSGVLARAEELAKSLGGAQTVHIVADDGLPAAYATGLARVLTPHATRVITSAVRASEDAKSLQPLHRILQDLASHNLERNDALIALGGGIVGDMAGFAAATYRRGIRWINCPTTLLAMVDASVGGKTGVNLRVGDELQKNMVGAFWQPSLVLADVSTLNSLPDRFFRAGLAECIKHGMLSADFGDEHLLHWTKSNLAPILARDPATLIELVARNIAVKAKVVEGDEREEADDRVPRLSEPGERPRTQRALLNLGHTFAHAIETIPQASPGKDPTLAPLQHGEAVALGLICASRCAELLKLVGDGLTNSVRRTLEHAGLPTIATGLPGSGEIYQRMLHDKKSAGGKLRLVLPSGEGRCKVVPAPDQALVKQAIDAIRA